MSNDKFTQGEGFKDNKSKNKRVFSQISAKFVGNYDFDNAINETLEEIGRLSGADRSYLFLISKEDDTMSNTHEWCADGVDPQKEILQKISNKSLPWWMQKLKHKEIIHITNVRKLPEEAKVKELLEFQNIKSLLVFPILVKNELEA
jgi:GAF domain-containing protein